MVERTKPSKLRVFGDSELGDCLDYFSEIQSNSNLPPNESLTASERLTLIRSEMDLRHADARHRRTQRLASWAIVVGLISIAVAVTSTVALYFVHKRTVGSLSAATALSIVAARAPTPLSSPNATPAVAATAQIAMADPTATPPAPALTTPTPKPTPSEQRHKKRVTRSKTKTKTDSNRAIEEALRSLFQPKPTPRPSPR